MNNNYLKLNQIILKLFNNNLVSKTFNPVFSLNLHIYKSFAFIYNIFNRNPNFINTYISLSLVLKLFRNYFFIHLFVGIYFKYIYYIEQKLE